MSMFGARRFLVLAGCVATIGCSPPSSEPGVERDPPVLEATGQVSGTTARLQAVFAVDRNVVWASGLEGTYAVTEDGGANWRTGRVPEADDLQFRDVHAFDAHTAFLLAAGEGETSRIYKTEDGGAEWSLRFVNLEPAGFLDCFDFWDRENGVVYGDSIDGVLYVLRTRDGGLTWARVAAEGLPSAAAGEGGFAASGTCVDVAADGRAWIGTGAGGAGRVLRSADRGETWVGTETPIVRGEYAGITSVVLAGDQLGFAFGGDLDRPSEHTANVVRTDDGGITWSLAGRLPFAGAAYGAAWTAGGHGSLLVAVGPGGLGYSADRGESWTLGHEGELWSVDFGDDRTFWAVGPAGSIVRFDLR